MKSTLSLSLVLLLALTAHAEQKGAWSFEDCPAGKLPKGWTAMKTGEGPGSEWKVQTDETSPGGAKVLAQVSSEGPRPLFNLCVLDEATFRNVDLTVAFKAVDGKIDQGGGPVWRLRDADNYYVARMNPLEDNFRLYKVEKGKRTKLASADLKVPAGEWHHIRIVHEGNRIQCFLDGKPYLELTDSTFTEAGKVGLWSKADAVTRFDDLRATEKAASK